MKAICLYFQVHQPFRFKRYRFFDIGNDHYYYDDYTNESILLKVAEKCYLPTNELLLKLINKHGDKFKIAFSLSGLALDQFELYAPEVLDSFKRLAATGNVEFLGETYAHSLVSLKNKEDFIEQIHLHGEKIEKYFGVKPSVFRNTELIYADEIGATVADLGFKGMLMEGAKHVLGWKSPNYLYCNSINPKLKLLPRNFKLSDDIAFRFSNKGWSEYPLTADKFVDWINKVDERENTINLFMDYETFGEHQWAESGIFNFLEALPSTILEKSKYSFHTPTEIIKKFQPVGALNSVYPTSWADEERDVTAWLGNDLQQESFNKLYSLAEKIKKTNDPRLLKDWAYLQTSDHFYYMCTKFFSDGAVHSYFNPYDSPYDAFINYMNILSDFSLRVDAEVPESKVELKVSNLYQTIEEKDKLIEKLQKELLLTRSTKKTTKKKPAKKKASKTTASSNNKKKTLLNQQTKPTAGKKKEKRVSGKK
jgi:alpha-amylase